MPYSSLRKCCDALERAGELVRLHEEIDGDLVIPEIHRRVYRAGGPALLFEKVKGSKFSAVSNLFGTRRRTGLLFDRTLKKFEWLAKAKADPWSTIKRPGALIGKLPYLLNALPRKQRHNHLNLTCSLGDLPKIRAWPKDGGAFVTMPQVISFPPGDQRPASANVGMYRIQLDGNDYLPDSEVGLHYQLHRGIGIHHLMHKQKGLSFRVSIAIGGPPAYSLAAVFPLPEGLSELLFSGLLNESPYRYAQVDGHFIPQEVDFCIVGTVQDETLKMEGPFGDHLGYYSLEHPFPTVRDVSVYHRKDPIWHFTVVGRPPQEDTGLGDLIHDFVSELTQNEYPGIRDLHAVDASGVHPLLLAVGSERYMPFRDRKPEEILTQANLLLGKGQSSLAKYLFIAAHQDDGPPSVRDVPGFLRYVLERVDFGEDLHFFTKTTIDTLDYSGESWNAGSKLLVACNRIRLRELSGDLAHFNRLPAPFGKARRIDDGVIAVQCEAFSDMHVAIRQMETLCAWLDHPVFRAYPLVVVVDDSDFTAASYENFLWICFTRSNPSHDVYGVGSKCEFKHWSCKPPLVIDARIKPHHAPSLEVHPETICKVDEIIFRNPALKKLPL